MGHWARRGETEMQTTDHNSHFCKSRLSQTPQSPAVSQERLKREGKKDSSELHGLQISPSGYEWAAYRKKSRIILGSERHRK